MDQSAKNANAATPTKYLLGVRSISSENSNPNLTSPSLTQKHSKSPLLPKSSGKVQKSAARNPNASLASPKIRIREREFVVPKKKANGEVDVAKDAKANLNCKCKDRVNGKCLCVAYETLRTSLEQFFKSWKDEAVVGEIDAEKCEIESAETPKGSGDSSGSKRRRDKLTEKVRESIQPGSGRVLKLVREFEKLLAIIDSENKDEKEQEEEERPKSFCLEDSGRVLKLVHAYEKLLTIMDLEDKDEKEQEEEDTKKGALGLQRPKAFETLDSSSFRPEEFVLTSESLGLDMQATSSSDSQQSVRSSAGRRGSTGRMRSHKSNSGPSNNADGRKLEEEAS